jgi:hypothetical protein
LRTGRINFPLLPAASSLRFPTAHHYTTKMESKVVHKMVIVGSGLPRPTTFVYYLLIYYLVIVIVIIFI